jgi:hypothetical protein
MRRSTFIGAGTTGIASALLGVRTVSGAGALQALSAGSVVALRGTPHIWISDDSGTLHWGGDTRALSGKAINWDTRKEVSLDEIRSAKKGDPWLSAGLVKDGDPICLVKWETTEAQPTLLHIQSIADVELFGINGSNYGQMVLERGEWERKHGFAVSALSRGTLATATGATSQSGTGSAIVQGPQLTVANNGVIRGRGSSENRGWVYGEVRNQGSSPAYGYRAGAVFTDDYGNTVASQGTSPSFTLMPGDTVGFKIDMYSLPAYKNLKVDASVASARANTSTTSGYNRSVSVSALSFVLEDYSGYSNAKVARATGTVTNDSQKLYRNVTVVFWFLNDSGQVVDVTSATMVGTYDVGIGTHVLRPRQPAQVRATSMPSSENAFISGARTVKALAFALEVAL